MIEQLSQEIADRAAGLDSLNAVQLAKFKEFSRIDDEWRMLMALGDRDARAEDRLEELDQLRTQFLNDEADPELAGVIRNFIQEVDVSQFESES